MLHHPSGRTARRRHLAHRKEGECEQRAAVAASALSTRRVVSRPTARHGRVALSNLIEFPEFGRVIPEFPDLGFREVLVDRYRFFYKSVGDVIWVVGTWHDVQIPVEPSELDGVPNSRINPAP